jgi:nucleotide-binding universal stress UspA family protein
VGYDGSEPANRAVERAVTLAGNDGRIIVVAAAESHAPAGIAEGAHLDRSEDKRRRDDLEQAKAIFSKRGVDR